MGIVSNRVCGWFLHVLDQASLSRTDWLAGLPVAPESLREPDGAIEWELFTELCRRFEAQFSSREALLEATRSYARERFDAEASGLPGGFSDQRQLYWLAQNWLRPSLFPDFTGSYEQLADGRLQLALAGPPDGSAPAVLFETIQALLMHTPLLVGQSPTRVDAELAEGRATYTIVPSAHADTDLRERESLYRRLTEHASDIIAKLDDDGVIIYASPNCLELLGYPSSDLLGRCAFDFLHADDGGRDGRRISEYLADRESNANFRRLRHRDGSWRWFHINTRRTQLPDSAERFILVARDVTEQQRAQRESEDWRDRYEAIIRASGQVVYDWDVKNGTVEFRGEGEQLGFTFDPAATSLDDYLVDLSPEDRRGFAKELTRAMKARDHFHFEFTIRPAAGGEVAVQNDGYFLFDDDGEIRRMVGFASDVSERKRGEEALRAQGDLLERIAGASPEVLYVFDVERWCVAFMNEAVETVLGYPPERFKSGGDDFIAEILHRDDRSVFAGYRERVRALTDEGIVEITCRIRHASGDWRWIRIRNRVLARGDDGRIRELLGTATDFTEHRLAQEAVQTSEARYRIVSELTSDYAFAVRINADQSMEREWITEAFSAITGYEPEEMSERQWMTLVHPDDHELRRAQFEEAIRTGQSSHEYRILKKSGELRVIREHARVIHDPDGSMHWYGACRDITDQKTAEVERALTQERFDAITQRSHDAVIESDDSGNILYVSPNVESLFGHRPADVMSKHRQEFVHPDDLPTLAERLKKVMEGKKSEDLVFRARNSADRWRWLETSATAFQTAAGEVRTVLVGRDISDRLEMEEEKRRLVSVVENSSEFIAMIADDGRILFLNDAGQRLVGLDDDAAARSSTIFDCLALEDSQDMRFKITPAVARTGHWDGDFRLRHIPTGESIATLAHVFQVARAEHSRDRVVAIVARDITERITGERLLRESEARHRMLVESAYDLIAEFDLYGRYVYLSPNFDRQLGYAPEELLTTSWLDQVHPDDRECAQAALRNLSAHSTHACPPLRMRHSDGRWAWVETNLKRYESVGGEALVLAFFRDITRRKIAEEELERSREELLQSQKMEAIGRLAGGVAHDFNNLLTAIIGYCDLLLEEVAGKSELRSDAEEIIRAANRAADLTRQLLAFSRRQVLLPKVLDLNHLVSDVDRLLRRLIGENVEFVTRLEGERPHVKLDPGQLEQLVINLAVNARDAMPRGGRLTLSTADLAIPSQGDPAHPGIASGRYILLTVEDTGIGMDAATLSKIFEPFFTTKGASKGTGLGLATVYGIIQQSGGEIRVESELGKGSTFTVYLPRVDEDVDPPEPATVDGVLRGGETILLVEDSETVRSLVKRYLEKYGYKVIDAPSGADALRSARNHDGDIALLVTDVVLPKMDGHALAQRLTQLRPDTRVLYMSGFSDDALSRHGVEAGDIALIQKPFAPPALLREVRRILGDPPPPPS